MTLRVAVVGAGKMGAHHARVFACAEGATLAGVLDVEPRAAEAVARRHGALVLRSLDEAIERADLVVVATPTHLHFAQARRVLAAGRAALVEKPLARSAHDAHALCEVARATGARLLVGHSERFNAVVRAIARDSADSEITHVSTRRTAAAPTEDVCVNLAVHDIDLVALLARAPVDLLSASGDCDTAELALRAGATAAHASVARRALSRVRTLVVRASRGTYVGDLLAGRLERDGAPIALDSGEPLALQAEAAIRAMRGEVSAIATGEAGTLAVAVAERAASTLADPRVSAAE
jgi:predicted dehydrogenase